MAGLARRVEEASLNAWPALHQVVLDGWVLRFTRGFTKRANSVTPLYPATQPPSEKIRYCEDLYAREGLRTIFRLTTVSEESALDELLARRGYASLDPTEVLHRSLAMGEFDVADTFSVVPVASFLATYANVQEPPAIDARAARTASELHRAVLRAIRGETVFGSILEDGEPVACGMAVVEREIVGLFDIVVHPRCRRLGHGRTLVGGLLKHAAERGARTAYLQVLNDNATARRLYAALGFEPLYEYRYRVSEHPAGRQQT
ncbi:MAG: GNAT family N-acetyltransferase [Gammaproteobacteria bacterium]|nr:GNAT family N-acetyltransferase [Gammaproteobacteria bacterium]